MNEKSLERMIYDDKPTVCEKCGSFLEYDVAGRYVCKNCGNVAYDGYGRLKEYVRTHPNSTIFEIRKALGLSTAQINMYLEDGTVSIPELNRMRGEDDGDGFRDALKRMPATSSNRFHVKDDLK